MAKAFDSTTFDSVATKRNTLYADELEIGMTRSRSKTVTRDCIATFGQVSGDLNPVHFCDDFAAATPFGGVVAHGMMSGALISAVIGEDLPGHGAIYLGQTMRFHGPVRPGDTITATCTVKEIVVEKRKLTLDCKVTVDGALVLSGEAVVLTPKRPTA